MKFFDVTLPLSPYLVSWPGDVKFSRKERHREATTSRLVISSHAGTHIDAPRHFFFRKSGVDAIALSKLVGRVRVVSVNARRLIMPSDINFEPKRGDKILFKTRNFSLVNKRKFTADYVSMSLEAARILARKKVDLVGIDYLGIEAADAPGFPVHKVLLRAGVVILEGLDLS
ncbi:MAG TPA: cyclase family protein, partial [Patescibacteria group bacterium]|nr:cyclase family protein [Patescibacteria group bacterium]